MKRMNIDPAVGYRALHHHLQRHHRHRDLPRDNLQFRYAQPDPMKFSLNSKKGFDQP